VNELALWFQSNWLAIIFGIVSIISLSYAFYTKPRRILEYSLEFEQVTLSNPSIDKLKITYNGEVIDKLFKAKLEVLNHGNKSISGNSIAKKDPLRVVIRNEARLLDYEKNCEKTANHLVAVEGKKEILISFDYLDVGDGFSLELILEKSGEVDFQGQIQECKIREKKLYKKLIKVLSDGLVAIAGAVTSIIVTFTSTSEIMNFDKFLIVILGIIFVVVFIMFLVLKKAKRNSKREKVNE